MTPERIAELRAKCADSKWEAAHNGVMIVRYNDLDALLAECERVSNLQASLSKACLMSGPDTEGTFVVTVSFENPDDATALFNFLKQAGATP